MGSDSPPCGHGACQTHRAAHHSLRSPCFETGVSRIARLFVRPPPSKSGLRICSGGTQEVNRLDERVPALTTSSSDVLCVQAHAVVVFQLSRVTTLAFARGALAVVLALHAEQPRPITSVYFSATAARPPALTGTRRRLQRSMTPYIYTVRVAGKRVGVL